MRNNILWKNLVCFGWRIRIITSRILGCKHIPLLEILPKVLIEYPGRYDYRIIETQFGIYERDLLRVPDIKF